MPPRPSTTTSDRPSRRETQRTALTAEIKAIALRQISAGGASSVSWRGIATEVGMNPASLYTYFGSLADLYTALIVDGVQDLSASLSAAVDDAPRTTTARLLAWAGAYRSWAGGHADWFNLCFTDVIPGYQAPPGGPTVRAHSSMFVPLARALGQEASDVGDLGAVDGSEVVRAVTFWSAVHGVTTLEINHHINENFVDVEAVVERAVEVAMAGTRRRR